MLYEVITIVVGIFVVGFFAGDMSKLSSAAIGWVFATGGFSALATAAALAHPLTILSAFLAAPITTLQAWPISGEP